MSRFTTSGIDIGVVGESTPPPTSVTAPTRRSLSGRKPGEVRHGKRTSDRRSAGSIIKEILLLIAGIGGIIALLWFIASLVFGLSIVVFMTGSMSPTLPTGAAAIVKEDVPAADLAVGDIVTVPRAGQPLPVTHRIVAIDSASDTTADPASAEPFDPAARVLTLRGDDNDTNDREPYTVTEVDRVIVGAPYAGYIINAVQTPLLFGGLVLAVALLVVWAFWPDRSRGNPPPRTTETTDPTLHTSTL